MVTVNPADRLIVVLGRLCTNEQDGHEQIPWRCKTHPTNTVELIIDSGLPSIPPPICHMGAWVCKPADAKKPGLVRVAERRRRDNPFEPSNIMSYRLV